MRLILHCSKEKFSATLTIFVDGVISVSMMTIFDIANADVLLGPSKACPHGELVSTLTEEIDAMYRLYTCLYQKDKEVTGVVGMLQHAILHRCANVMEILTTQNLIVCLSAPKITVCLVNIIDAVTINKATIKLPKGIAKELDVTFTEEPLPEELLDKLKNLNISEGT